MFAFDRFRHGGARIYRRLHSRNAPPGHLVVVPVTVTVPVAVDTANALMQTLRLETRQFRRIEREHEELIRVRRAVRVMRVGDRADEVVVVRDEERVFFRAADGDVVAERDALELRRNIGRGNAMRGQHAHYVEKERFRERIGSEPPPFSPFISLFLEARCSRRREILAQDVQAFLLIVGAHFDPWQPGSPQLGAMHVVAASVQNSQQKPPALHANDISVCNRSALRLTVVVKERGASHNA